MWSDRASRVLLWRLGCGPARAESSRLLSRAEIGTPALSLQPPLLWPRASWSVGRSRHKHTDRPVSKSGGALLVLAASSAPHWPPTTSTVRPHREVFDRVRVVCSEPRSFNLAVPAPTFDPSALRCSALGLRGLVLFPDDRLLSLHSLPDLCVLHCVDDSACLAITCSMVLASDGLHSVDQVCDRVCQLSRQT